MEKYIRTYHKGTLVVIKISGCQFCPLMKFNTIENICECRYFGDKNGNSVVDPFVINSTLNGTVNDKIKPPTWCGLPNDLTESMNYRNTFKVFDNAVSVERTKEATGEILDGSTIKFDKNIPMDNFNNFLHKVMDTPFDDDENYVKFTNDDSIRINNDFDPNEFNSFIPAKKHEVCSCCGEENTTVERLKNIGMCDNCWEKNKDNENTKRQTFINNFRLKRNVNIPKETVKILNDIKI